MAYIYRTGLNFSVNPNDAGRELERIRKKYQQLQPRLVVAESQAEDAVLHPIFEWNDDKAANSFRESQARNLIRSVLIVRDKNTSEPMYVHVRRDKRDDNSYEPTSIVISQPDLFAVAVEELRDTMASAAESVLTLLDLVRKSKANQRAKKVVAAKEAVDEARQAVLAI